MACPAVSRATGGASGAALRLRWRSGALAASSGRGALQVSSPACPHARPMRARIIHAAASTGSDEPLPMLSAPHPRRLPVRDTHVPEASAADVTPASDGDGDESSTAAPATAAALHASTSGSDGAASEPFSSHASAADGAKGAAASATGKKARRRRSSARTRTASVRASRRSKKDKDAVLPSGKKDKDGALSGSGSAKRKSKGGGKDATPPRVPKDPWMRHVVVGNKYFRTRHQLAEYVRCILYADGQLTSLSQVTDLHPEDIDFILGLLARHPRWSDKGLLNAATVYAGPGPAPYEQGRCFWVDKCDGSEPIDVSYRKCLVSDDAPLLSFLGAAHNALRPSLKAAKGREIANREAAAAAAAAAGNRAGAQIWCSLTGWAIRHAHDLTVQPVSGSWEGLALEFLLEEGLDPSELEYVPAENAPAGSVVARGERKHRMVPGLPDVVLADVGLEARLVQWLEDRDCLQPVHAVAQVELVKERIQAYKSLMTAQEEERLAEEESADDVEDAESAEDRRAHGEGGVNGHDALVCEMDVDAVDDTEGTWLPQGGLITALGVRTA